MYLSETMMISDQEIKDSTPRMFSCVVSMPPAKHSRSRVQRARADVAVHDAQRTEGQLDQVAVASARGHGRCGAGSAWFGREAVATGGLGAVTGSDIDLAARYRRSCVARADLAAQPEHGECVAAFVCFRRSRMFNVGGSAQMLAHARFQSARSMPVEHETCRFVNAQ